MQYSSKNDEPTRSGAMPEGPVPLRFAMLTIPEVRETKTVWHPTGMQVEKT
jgi:hypothetical protein